MEAKDEQENKPGSEGRSNQANCPCLRHWSTGLKWELLSSRTQFLRTKCNKTNKSPLLSFCRLLKSNLLVSFNHVARYLSNASFSHFVLISSSNPSLIQFLVHFWGLKVVDCRICGDNKSILRIAFIEFTDEGTSTLNCFITLKCSSFVY